MTEKLNADAEKTNSGNPEVASLEAMADEFDPDKARKLRNEAIEQKLGYVVEDWSGFPDTYEGIDETEADINGVPQTVWRGERLYLDNIDELGHRIITTKGHEAKSNRNGQTFLSRDKKYASLYAVGTDGVIWYDGPLPKEQIPIGVVYKINNDSNHLDVMPTDEHPDDWGPFEGKFREFITETSIMPDDYSVEEIYIMDDFLQPDGHKRSDFRRPTEVYKITDQSQIPEVIEKVKQRMSELDTERNF